MAPLSDTPPRERVRHARRAALLEAAECVFAEHGFAGATVADIASRAGYSAGNLYNVFENKEALFREVIATRDALFVQQLTAALEGGGPIVEGLDRFIDVFLGFGEKHRAFFTILSQPTGSFEWGTGSSSERSTHIRDIIESKINDFFTRAVDAQEIPLVSAHVYSAVVSGALSATMAHWIRSEGEPADLWKDADELRAVLRRALGVSP